MLQPTGDPDDYEVTADGQAVGRIVLLAGAWTWATDSAFRPGRHPAHGFERRAMPPCRGSREAGLSTSDRNTSSRPGIRMAGVPYYYPLLTWPRFLGEQTERVSAVALGHLLRSLRSLRSLISSTRCRRKKMGRSFGSPLGVITFLLLGR